MEFRRSFFGRKELIIVDHPANPRRIAYSMGGIIKQCFIRCQALLCSVPGAARLNSVDILRGIAGMALIACRECGHQMSSEAKRCPNCSAPNRSRWGGGKIALLILGGIVALLVVGSQLKPPVNDAVHDGLLAKRAECQEHLNGLLRAGLRVDRDHAGETWAEIEEVAWGAVDHDTKVRTALTIYCADMPDDGRYGVVIRGRRNGHILATISNGNYFDN